MQGALLPVTIEWIVVALAPILAIATCLRDVLWSCRVFGFRNGIAGPASNVQRTGPGGDFTDVYDQMSRLGYQPAGISWERALLMPKFRVYAFFNPQRNGFAIVYRLFGKDLHVVFMTLFTDGTMIKTYDSPGETVDEPKYVVNRLPSKPVADLLEQHEQTEAKMIADGLISETTRDIESIVAAQYRAFFHPSVVEEMRNNGRTMLLAKLTIMGSAAVPMSLCAALCFAWPAVSTMLLLGAASWVVTVSALFLGMRMLIRLISTGEKREVDDTPATQLYTVLIAKWIVPLGPLIGGAAWAVGVANTALWTLVVVSSLAAIDLIRVFCNATRHPFAQTQPEPDT